MTYSLLLRIVEELALLITDAKLERVLQGADRNIYLLFRKNRNRHALLVSPRRSGPRLHLVSRKPEAAADIHPFALQLRSRLVGARLGGISLLNQDRVAALRFTKEAVDYFLVFELTGSSANLFFCDRAMRILALYHPVAAGDHPRRLLLPGCRYEPPPRKDGPPAVAAEAAASGSPNEDAERSFEKLGIEERFVSLSARLRAAVKKAVDKAERRKLALASDLRSLQEGEHERRKGDLLLANLGSVKAGADSVELSGPDGARVTVALDPRLTAARNAERYYKKYKKAKAGLPLALARARRTDEELSALCSRLSEIGSAGNAEELLRIEAALAEEGFAAVERRGPGKKSGAPPAGVRKATVQGWEVLIGRNAAGNDAITTKLARPHDLWLHAEGLPGSHVLVRNPGKKDVPPPVLLAAAALAARYSKGRGAGKVPVSYCEARYVSKPKGAKPGLVVLLRRKTVLVEPRDGTDR